LSWVFYLPNALGVLPFQMGDINPMSIVYFFAAPDRIKIGFTANLLARFQSLESASLLPLEIVGHIPGTRDLERAIHAEAAPHRIKGEWFADCPEVRAIINRAMQDGASAFNVTAPASRSKNKEVLWAASALKRIAGPRSVGDSMRDAVVRAAERCGLSYWRAFDLWYAKAHRLEPSERSSITNAMVVPL
jgi:hypothetical protein